MTNLYNDKDIKLITENIDKKAENARSYAINYKLEPSLNEYKKMFKIVIDFVKNRNRILYGGYALHLYSKDKNPADSIYNENIDYPDVEFYSTYPWKDVIDLCNLLHDKNMKFVQGAEAHHHETYSIFVNSINIADISYMPKILYNKIDIVKINNIPICHPNFIYIDLMRQFNNPITANNRWSKATKRGLPFMKNYPLRLKGKLTKIKIDKSLDTVLTYVRQYIIANSNLLVFGYYAYEYFKYKGINKESELYVPYYDAFYSPEGDTNNNKFETDVKKIFKKLKDYDKNIVVEEYYKFFQFLDRRVCFKFNGRVILNIYDNNGLCIPYLNIEKKKIKIVTYPYMIQTLLITSLYNNVVSSNKDEHLNHNELLTSLVKIRNDFFKASKKNLFDDTIFEEFRIKCEGDTVDPLYANFLGIQEKLKKKIKQKLRYDPLESNNMDVLLNYNYDNCSGKINFGRDKIFY